MVRLSTLDLRSRQGTQAMDDRQMPSSLALRFLEPEGGAMLQARWVKSEVLSQCSVRTILRERLWVNQDGDWGVKGGRIWGRHARSGGEQGENKNGRKRRRG